ncbi:MAG: ABC transporter ATP-binding protein [Candidatus Woesearchaeota archaeon]
MSFNINKNEKVGVVGYSGSGKSTLSKLLLGLYKINSGEIKIDEKNFYGFEHQNLLDNISLVIQETEMFNMSLRDNISMLKEIDSNTLQKAIKIAQLEDVIKKLPDGLDTVIGEKGYKLSGGERQRVGIARAICKNSNILILDEATSSLDPETELKIQEGLDLLENKTMIIIAHRLSTLKNVDKILVFDKGRLVEQGNFKELLKDPNSKFYYIWSMQK